MPKETNKKQNKEKKHFMKDFKAELKRVIWPTPKQLANNTIAVITIVLITAIIVFALDFIFETVNRYGIEGVKSLVDTTNAVNDTNTQEDSEENSNVSDENSANETTAQNNNETEKNEVNE